MALKLLNELLFSRQKPHAYFSNDYRYFGMFFQSSPAYVDSSVFKFHSHGSIDIWTKLHYMQIVSFSILPAKN